MFKVKPIFKNYIWGGTNLRTLYHKQSDLEVLAESWELSTHKEDICTIAEGEYQGKLLTEYFKILGDKAMGSKYLGQEELPILVKLIDAKDNLSVQVHPNDEYAIKYENDLGKTEMWIVLEAEEGAQLVYGLKESLSKMEFARHIKEERLSEVLNYVEVKKGDVFFIEPGTIHAIGKGIIIAEIQQSSNVTYRVYDYGRLDADGKPRELHIEKAMEVCHLGASKDAKISYQLEEHKGYKRAELADCPYFKVEYIEVSEKIKLETDGTSFHALLVIEGEVQVLNEQYNIKAVKGENVFIPAFTGEYKVVGNGKLILSYT